MKLARVRPRILCAMITSAPPATASSTTWRRAGGPGSRQSAGHSRASRRSSALGRRAVSERLEARSIVEPEPINPFERREFRRHPFSVPSSLGIARVPRARLVTTCDRVNGSLSVVRSMTDKDPFIREHARPPRPRAHARGARSTILGDEFLTIVLSALILRRPLRLRSRWSGLLEGPFGDPFFAGSIGHGPSRFGAGGRTGSDTIDGALLCESPKPASPRPATRRSPDSVPGTEAPCGQSPGSQLEGIGRVFETARTGFRESSRWCVRM